MRRILIKIHLWVAALVAPAFILVAISGGLYLIGIKGTTETQDLPIESSTSVDFKAADLETKVRALLAEAGIEQEFEYLRVGGNSIQTRPTSKTYLQLEQGPQGLTITRHVPDLQKTLIELHKGHGPTAFKTYQKFVAVALLLSVISGLWMGLASPAFRRTSVIGGVVGVLLFLFLAFA